MRGLLRDLTRHHDLKRKQSILSKLFIEFDAHKGRTPLMIDDVETSGMIGKECITLSRLRERLELSGYIIAPARQDRLPAITWQTLREDIAPKFLAASGLNPRRMLAT